MKNYKLGYIPLFSLFIAAPWFTAPCQAWPSRSPDSTKFQELPSGVANGSYDGTKVEELSDSKNLDDYEKAKERRRIVERSRGGYDLNPEERARGRLKREPLNPQRLLGEPPAPPPPSQRKAGNLEGDEGLD